LTDKADGDARDSMPIGGTFTLSTENVELLEKDGNQELGAPVGHYAVLFVSETGVGMDKETLNHIFEPFFTTKEVGQGTGLGLASVYGIAKQSGGYFQALSKPGSGTKFQIYFPRVSSTVPEHELPATIPEPRRFGSRIAGGGRNPGGQIISLFLQRIWIHCPGSEQRC